MWAGRKAAFSAMGRLQPDMICMDGTIPRHALPQVLEGIAAMSERYGLGCCNVFHAGDGNLHPLIIFDAMKEGELATARRPLAPISCGFASRWAACSPASMALASKSAT